MMSQPFDREPDDLDIAFRAMGDLLASVPHQLGYRLEGSDQLAIQVSGPGGRFLLPVDWPADQPNLHAARQTARAIEAVIHLHPSDAVLLLGYGPEAAERVYALREALRHQLEDTGDNISIAAIQVDQGQWRAFGVGVTGEWHPVPEVPVSILMAGFPAPAASLQEYRQQFQPLPEPTYGALPDSSRDLIDASPPGIRVELADRALQRLADRDPNPLDLPALAHVLDDPAVNHAVVAHTYSNRARLGSLVDAYRGAPSEQQPAVAAAAATALWLHGRIQEAQQVSAHVPDGTYFAASRDQLNALINAGVSPTQTAPRFTAAAETHLKYAETTWSATQPLAPGAPSEPAPPAPQPDADGPQL